MTMHAIEEPAYEVTQRIGDVEVRRYAPYAVAEVRVTGSATAAGNQAFPILAGYIFGKNKGQKKFPMTAPVTQSAAGTKMQMTAPVTQNAVSGGFVVQFVLPRGVTLAASPSSATRVSGPMRTMNSTFRSWNRPSGRPEKRGPAILSTRATTHRSCHGFCGVTRSGCSCHSAAIQESPFGLASLGDLERCVGAAG